MKQILITTTFMSLIFISPLTLATDDRSAQVEQRLEEAKTRLNLSDEQLAQITPVMEKSLDAQRNILSRYGIDPDSRNDSAKRLGLRQARAMRQELRAVRADTLDALDEILTDEQLDEFKRMQEERKAEMRERIRGGNSNHSRWPSSPATGRSHTLLM